MPAPWGCRGRGGRALNTDTAASARPAGCDHIYRLDRRGEENGNPGIKSAPRFPATLDPFFPGSMANVFPGDSGH